MLLYYLSLIETPEDRSKFEQIYNLHKSTMMYTALQTLHDWQLAEDCVHNAFESILRNMNCVGDPASKETRALLVIITKRRAVDIYRKTNKEVLLDNVEALIPPITPPGDNGLADIMAKLPASYQHVLILRYVHGYNSQEIGNLLGMTASGARKLLARAKTKLREELMQNE